MPKGIFPRRVKRHAVNQPLDKPYRYIPLTQQQVAIVDVRDFKRLSKHSWYASWCPFRLSFVAVRRENKRGIYMHRVVLGCKKGEEADHKNFNTLDNRRENLRKCNHSQNNCNKALQNNNTSGFKGVAWDKQTSRWRVQIRANGNTKTLGRFDSLKEAAHAYDVAAKFFHREFARLNFPKD